MTPFAEAEDVAAVWQPLTTEQESLAEALLEQASTKLRVLVPTIDAQIEADVSGLKRSLAKAAVVNGVKRVLSNPDGLLQETIDDYTWRRDSAVSSGALYIDAADLVGLRVKTSRKWGTINLGHAL